MDIMDRLYLAALVKRTQKSDSDAFAELYALTYKAQYVFAQKYLRDEYLAQDAIQEVYILVLKNIVSLKEPQYFLTWLRQINIRVCYDLAEKRKKFPKTQNEYADEIADDNSSNNPEHILLNNMKNEELKEAVMKLPFKERDAIIMKFSGNMSLNDIAESMNCSVSSVTRYLSRGYKHLKEILREGGHTE